ncbi:MAG: 50S ribosomal protein L29 [Candidatus Marinimicrobia bacterium]|nr:50S ribosomal protein L29 [Candidatus Neomarinimicrobiota bacterium]MCH7851179.1 50S ribosomal protein L29 [Candidatus Neomarinimicrobiota bacterium]MCH7938797.1 50S ribosomal protein L29 [Candidatus Neomarinimicrobiota bacterium]MCH8024107.1 50S ribosomal protein L29 [Candidatus Neomarinimicrobiota bacterium]MCH8836428.1 50S ribosomal protein L29 [Candidatus Neomarinimicrobiota bacterium]
MISDDLLSFSVGDLQQQLLEKQEELTNLRFQQALQQLEHSHRMPVTRREIARIKTLLREYELGRRELKEEE